MKKVLWVIPKWTFPITDGARVATDRLIRNTIKDDLEVDVLCLGQENEIINKKEMIESWGIKKVDFVPRGLPQSRLAKMFYYGINFLSHPLTPITFSSFTDNSVRKGVNKIIENEKYDIAVLDGLHLAGPFYKNGTLAHENIQKFVYRAHNIEKDLWAKASSEKKNFLFKLFLKFQFYLVEKFENNVIRNSDMIGSISQEDLEIIESISDKPNSKLIPLGLDFSKPLKVNESKSENLKLLFIGRLDWPPNKDGLEWFLMNVWPKVIAKRNDIELSIVGSGNSSWLQKYKTVKNLNVIGFVDSIKESYQECDFTIAPIFYGSGTRIKVLESFAMGRPLITTKMGIQGAGLNEDDYLRVEEGSEWIELLKGLEITPVIKKQLKNGQDKLTKDFDEKFVGDKFYNLLMDL
jgi:glycosyltransferase involved in cell wall biosynthesis